MKNTISIFVCVVIIVIESCFIANEFKSNNETVTQSVVPSVVPSVAVMTLPSVLQDVQFSDGKAYMFGKPVVFDEGCCMLLSAVFNNDAELPLIATMYTEYEDYVYMQLN